jgi:cell division protein FtsN
MTPTLIVLALVALGVGIVVWAVRKKPSSTTTGPKETDTAWNDPVTPGEPAQPIEDRNEPAPRPQTPQEPRP